MDIYEGHGRQKGANGLCSLIQEDGVGDRQRDGGASDLRTSDEADSDWDLLRANLRLRYREGSLDESAGADAGEDGVAVDAGSGGGDLDGVEESFTDESEDATEEEPRRVVACGGHDGAVGDTCEDHDTYLRQKMYSSCKGGRVAYELEEERDEVDRDECRGACAGGGAKQ